MYQKKKRVTCGHCLHRSSWRQPSLVEKKKYKGTFVFPEWEEPTPSHAGHPPLLGSAFELRLGASEEVFPGGRHIGGEGTEA